MVIENNCLLICCSFSEPCLIINELYFILVSLGEHKGGFLTAFFVSNRPLKYFRGRFCFLCIYGNYRGRVRYDEVYPKWQLLGTHGARRTFICVSLELGIPATVIQKITGHANEAAMRPYIAITDKTIREAMDLFSRRGG